MTPLQQGFGKVLTMSYCCAALRGLRAVMLSPQHGMMVAAKRTAVWLAYLIQACRFRPQGYLHSRSPRPSPSRKFSPSPNRSSSPAPPRFEVSRSSLDVSSLIRFTFWPFRVLGFGEPALTLWHFNRSDILAALASH